MLSNILNHGIELFPPLIWKFSYNFKYDELESKIENLFSLVKVNSNLEIGNAISTVSISPEKQPHSWPELEIFQEWLGERIFEIRKIYNFQYNNSEVTNSWVNRHYFGGETIEHTHSFSTFVVSCYLKCPENSGNIVFKDPLEYQKHSFPIIPELSLYKEVPVKTNDVLIFPGWLKHRVQANQTNNERVVLTFNIK